MQLPFTQLLGLASGAVDLVQKAFTHGSRKGGDFDAELTSALQGKSGHTNSLTEILAKKGLLDDEALQGLLGTAEGLFLFQFMSALKQMGLQTSDIQLMLGGNGAQISDDALKGFLSQAGIGQAELDAVMADPKAVADIKAQLSDSIKALFDASAQKNGIDPDTLRNLTSTDSNTIDEVIQAVENENRHALSAESAAAAQAKKQGEQEMHLTLGLIQRNVSHTTNEIRAIAAAILKDVVRAGTASDKAAETAATEGGDPEISLKADAAMSMAEKTLGISKDVLKDLFFATDPVLRQQAVEQVTTQVNAYLRSQQGKPLSPEAANMLAFLKAGMSEQEFSGIDQSLKLWQPEQVMADSGFKVNKEMYTALSKNLTGNDAPAVFENHMKQVIDQLKQTLPSQMKNGEGQITLRLNPPMLGKVDVSMTMQDGQIQALFKTDQAVTRDILVQNMNVLKEALAEQGIKATSFSVTMNFDGRSPRDGYAYAFEGHDRQNQGSGQGGRHSDNSGRTYRENDGTVYAQANYSGLLETGLDFFA